jgi:hypothetical protein
MEDHPAAAASATTPTRLPYLDVLSSIVAISDGCRRRGRWLAARRWPPGRDIVLVGDSGFAALEQLAALARYGIKRQPALPCRAI